VSKKDDPLFALHEYNVDQDGMTIYLMGEDSYSEGADGEWATEPGVEYSMSNRLIRNLQALQKSPKDSKGKLRPIIIHMKTCGGDWSEGMAIYDAIYHCPNPVVILNYTHARSMSSLILQAADKRVMMPHSYYMFHEGDATISGTEKQVRSYQEFFSKLTPVMLNIYTDSMREKGKFHKSSRSTIKKMLTEMMDKKEEVYLTAKETVTWGLADEIFDGNWEKLKKVKVRK